MLFFILNFLIRLKNDELINEEHHHLGLASMYVIFVINSCRSSETVTKTCLSICVCEDLVAICVKWFIMQ